eukprot:36517-Eustigmatos_ZCMA.PRE.1
MSGKQLHSSYSAIGLPTILTVLIAAAEHEAEAVMCVGCGLVPDEEKSVASTMRARAVRNN